MRELINKAFLKFYLNGELEYRKLRNLAYSNKQDFLDRRILNISNTLSNAFNNIPYYHDLFANSSLRKGNKICIQSLEELELIPILTKSIIREQGDRMYHKNYLSFGSKVNTSGGSTGEPLTIIQDKEYSRHGAGLFAFIKELRIGSPYSRSVILWGAARDFFGEETSIKDTIADFVNNTKKFNSAKLTPESIQYFINYCNEISPIFILAYVQSIYEIALYAERHKLDVKPAKCIHTGAGQLFPFMREKIEKIFNCKVFDHYGSRESGAMATESSCHDGLHILGDSCHLEIVDNDNYGLPFGKEGEILVTTFTNKSMPLIRYRIEDRGIMDKESDCSCGLVYPRLKRIVGRTSNNFALKMGGFVSGEYLTLSYNHVPGILNFQIRQKEFDRIEIFLTTNLAYDKVVNENLQRKNMKKLFGNDLKLTFHYVSEIPKTLTGKHLFTISEVI